MIKAAILGASGYVGGELLRLIGGHGGIAAVRLFAASSAGQPVKAVHPHLGLAYAGRSFEAYEQGALDGCDLVFAALPHGDHIGMDEPFAGMFTQGMVVHETYQKADGGYVTPAEVKIETIGSGRRATMISGGEEISIGPIEKMSKSKRNTVDPDDIIATYGADVARWFMLSDSPPDRDVIWSDERVQGASRFVQRLWRLVNESAGIAQSAPAARPAAFGADALVLRKAAHGALDKVSTGIEKLHFNVCLAHIREFTNALAEVLGREGQPSPDLAWSVREAAVILVQLFAPMMPHLAEECWTVLGQKGLISEANWPQIERDLLIEDTVTLVVQVNGKKRGDVTVPRGAENPEIEAAVLALDAVKQALGGKAVRKVIVVPMRIVNVVG